MWAGSLSYYNCFYYYSNALNVLYHIFVSHFVVEHEAFIILTCSVPNFVTMNSTAYYFRAICERDKWVLLLSLYCIMKLGVSRSCFSSIPVFFIVWVYSPLCGSQVGSCGDSQALAGQRGRHGKCWLGEITGNKHIYFYYL